jgi:hypothetical protein
MTTIIAAMTNAAVTNNRMRLIMGYLLSVKGGTRQTRLRLHNATTLASFGWPAYPSNCVF